MKRQKTGGPPAGEGFCWYTREMLLAPAFREASISCRRLINALEFENMSHAGTENGNLVMPYNQLERWWHIPRRLIRRAIDEAIEHGLIEERRGLRLWYAKSMPTRFRLTFRPTRQGSPPQWVDATNEWRRFQGRENASKGSDVALGSAPPPQSRLWPWAEMFALAHKIPAVQSPAKSFCHSAGKSARSHFPWSARACA